MALQTLFSIKACTPILVVIQNSFIVQTMTMLQNFFFLTVRGAASFSQLDRPNTGSCSVCVEPQLHSVLSGQPRPSSRSTAHFLSHFCIFKKSIWAEQKQGEHYATTLMSGNPLEWPLSLACFLNGLSERGKKKKDTRPRNIARLTILTSQYMLNVFIVILNNEEQTAGSGYNKKIKTWMYRPCFVKNEKIMQLR